MSQFFRDYISDEAGAAAAEYALILAIVGAGIAGAAYALGGAVKGAMNTTATTVTDCVDGQGTGC